MTLGSKENYINAAANYAWYELPQALTGGEACLTTIFGILLVSQISILDSISSDAGKLSRLMVATHKYKETYDMQASRRKAKLGFIRRRTAVNNYALSILVLRSQYYLLKVLTSIAS
jgi:hypothetical protein